MAKAPEVGTSRVFVVVNAKSGNSTPDEVRGPGMLTRQRVAGSPAFTSPAKGRIF